MTFNESELKQFKKMSFNFLSMLFSLEDRREPVLDIKPIGERIEDVEKDVEDMLEKTIEFNEALSYIFGNSTLPREAQTTALRTEAILTHMAASYDPRTNTIRLTSYPDVQSILKFHNYFKLPLSKPPKKLKESMSDNTMLEEIASEIGHSCRALAREYAYTDKYQDNIIIAANKETGIIFLNSDNIIEEKEKVRKIVRNNNLQVKLRVDMSEFFDGVAMNEISEFMVKIGSYQFAPRSYYEEARMLKLVSNLSPIKEVDGSVVFDSASNSAIQGTLEHLPLTFALYAYKDKKTIEEFRKQIFGEGFIYMPPVKLFEEVLMPSLKDYLVS